LSFIEFIGRRPFWCLKFKSVSLFEDIFRSNQNIRRDSSLTEKMSSFTVGFHLKEDKEDCDPLETSTVQHFNEKGKF